MNLDWQDAHMRRAWIFSMALTALCSAGYVVGRLAGLEDLKLYSAVLMAPGFMLAFIPAMLLGGNVHDPNEVILFLMTPLLNFFILTPLAYMLLSGIASLRRQSK